MQIHGDSPGTDLFEAKKLALCEAYGNGALRPEQYAELLGILLGSPVAQTRTGSAPTTRALNLSRDENPGTAESEATLREVSVTFILPPGDDRDSDTRTDVEISAGTDVIATAENIAAGQPLTDPGNYGPFPLTLRASVTKAQFSATENTLKVIPIGHDQWITNVRVDARFSDGATLVSQSGVVVVDQDIRTATFRNSGRVPHQH